MGKKYLSRRKRLEAGYAQHIQGKQRSQWDVGILIFLLYTEVSVTQRLTCLPM